MMAAELLPPVVREREGIHGFIYIAPNVYQRYNFWLPLTAGVMAGRGVCVCVKNSFTLAFTISRASSGKIRMLIVNDSSFMIVVFAYCHKCSHTKYGISNYHVPCYRILL